MIELVGRHRAADEDEQEPHDATTTADGAGPAVADPDVPGVPRPDVPGPGPTARPAEPVEQVTTGATLTPVVATPFDPVSSTPVATQPLDESVRDAVAVHTPTTASTSPPTGSAPAWQPDGAAGLRTDLVAAPAPVHPMPDLDHLTAHHDPTGP